VTLSRQSEVVTLLKQQTGKSTSSTDAIEAMLLASNEALMKELQASDLLTLLVPARLTHQLFRIFAMHQFINQFHHKPLLQGKNQVLINLLVLVMTLLLRIPSQFILFQVGTDPQNNPRNERRGDYLRST
jgi:hypothetical protein